MRSPTVLSRLVSRFANVRVLVIGDLMLDQYIWGQVQRISPEAPIPIVQVTKESVSPGGAANVVANIRALGGVVTVCGVIGKDTAGKRLQDEIATLGADPMGIVTSSSARTTTKTRIIAHHQQVVRLDREQSDLSPSIKARLSKFFRQHIRQFNVVIVSDYGKGVLDATLLAQLAELRQQLGFLYLIDPKQRNFAHYQGASLVKPNLSEAALASGLTLDTPANLAQAGSRLLSLWQAEAVLVSRGEDGMSLFRPAASPCHFPATAREVFDVTGAGDTVLAVCALALGAGASLEEATILANHAAGVVVGKVGTASVHPYELQAVLSEQHVL